jgi:nucleolar protein 12
LVEKVAAAISGDGPAKGRRKRKRDDEELEARYMQRLELEEAREDAKRKEKRHPKRPKASAVTDDDTVMVNGEAESESESEDVEDEVESANSESGDAPDIDVPKHESLAAPGEDSEIAKANRTVFVGNVSSAAVSSKTDLKTLKKHMSSLLESLPAEKVSHKIESVRFRSTAFSIQLPKKAAFAKKEVMDATTKSTNAYIVYSTKVAAREALKLNGTVVLDRHIRVDSVAHPAKNEPRKCVFVGNLGFVDDESAIQAANEEEGKSKKQKKREPGDVEEGLWREFGKCGTVESVRVIRDPKTRVGKGFAYVQFMVSSYNSCRFIFSLTQLG